MWEAIPTQNVTGFVILSTIFHTKIIRHSTLIISKILTIDVYPVNNRHHVILARGNIPIISMSFGECYCYSLIFS